MGSFVARYAPPVLVFVLLFSVWYGLCATVYADKAFLLPGPLAVAQALRDNAHLVVSAGLITLSEALTGYALAIVLGILFAAMMSQSRTLERSFYPYAVLLQTVPIVTIAPIIVLWFGYGQLSVVIISFVISLFPILNNTLLGLLSTSRNLVDLFSLHRAGRFAKFTKLTFPVAVPSIVAGLRISAGLSVIGAIIGEFIIGSGNSQGGIGIQIIYAQGRMYTSLLFALVLAATLLGFAFFTIVSYVGNLFLGNWHESAQAHEV
jgi:NitT/TauT family transport system permease protein